MKLPVVVEMTWEVPANGFISTATSFQASAFPSVQEKLVTVLAESGPFVLDAPVFPELITFHCVVVDAPFVKPWRSPDPTTSITQEFAFALSFLAVVGMGVVWSTPLNEITTMAAGVDEAEVTTTLAVPLGGFTRYHIDVKGFCVSATASVRAIFW